MTPEAYDWLFREVRRRASTGEQILSALLGVIRVDWDPTALRRAEARMILEELGIETVEQMIRHMRSLPDTPVYHNSLAGFTPHIEDPTLRREAALRFADLARTGPVEGRRQAVEALGCDWVYDPAALPALRAAIRDNNTLVRVWALRSLRGQHIPDEESLGAMMDGLADPEPAVVQMAIGGIQDRVRLVGAQQALPRLRLLSAGIVNRTLLDGTVMPERWSNNLQLPLNRLIGQLENPGAGQAR